MKRIYISLVMSFLMAFSMQSIQAQSTTDTVKPKKALKNSIMLNITAPILFGSRNLILGYERVLSKNQSFSIYAGQAALPQLRHGFNTDSIALVKDKKRSGYNINADYRFYLGSVNKYDAPRGVYVGPYIAYVHFAAEHNWTINNDPEPPRNATTSTTFNVFTVGAQLGYQFVFWRRFAVDLGLIGPGISNYNFTAKINGGILTEEEKEKLQERLQQALENKFPGMNIAFGDNTIKGNGVVRTWSVGFRYVIHIGFRF